MRKLFILRGCQSSGKSQIIKELGVENNTLSFNLFRSLFYDTRSTLDDNEYCITGDVHIYDKKIIEAMMNAAESRMSMGSTLFIDNMNLNVRDLSKWRSLAQRYYYKLFVVDVQKETTEQEILTRNKDKRHHSVDENILLDAMKKGNNNNFLKEYNVISPKDIQKELSFEQFVVDASQYKKVVVIGDVHGHYESLLEILDSHGGINNRKNLYVFSGDLIDRGDKNVEVVDFILGRRRENVIVVEGNHEMNMRHVLSSTKQKISAQTKKTRVEFLEKGWKDKDIRRVLLDKTVPFVVLKNVVGTSKPVLVTHAGITANNFEQKAALYPVTEFIYGSSSRNKVYRGHSTYSGNVDELINKYSSNEYIQVHGHRNGILVDDKMEYPFKTEDIYNVEAGVTDGGKMRAAIFNDLGVMSQEVGV